VQLKRLLLTTTSLCLLSLAPMPALAQDAALSAAYGAYVEASSGDDAAAKAAAETAFMAECQRLGLTTLDACIAVATGAASAEAPAPAAEEAPAAETPPPADQPAAEPAPAEEPAPVDSAPPPADPAPEQPAEPAAPATEQPAEPAPAEQAPAEPAPAEPATDAQPQEQSNDAASDPALLAAYETYVLASSGSDASAKSSAEAAFMAECNRLGIPSLEQCLALFGAAPAAQPAQPATEAPAQPATEAPAADQPVEDVPNAETPDAPAAPVLDSAKDGTDGAEAPAAEQPQQPAEAAAPQAPPTEQEVTAVIDGEGEQVDAPPPVEQPPVADAKPAPQGDDDKPRFIINVGINIGIFTPYKDRDRIWRDGDEVRYDRLDGDRYRQTVIRPDGTKIITVWDRDGEIIRRIKVLPDGTRIVLVYYPEDGRDRDQDWRDPGNDLPPFVLPIPVNEYVLYSESSDEDRIEDFLSQPPLEVASRVYTVEEVKRSARLRDTVRRVEIGDLTFDTGSAQLGRDQVGSLGKVAEAMKAILARNPGEVFLIEGHTDAVGSDESNLVLSDDRAETVANLLTQFYDIPPENLTTQGYGERYLKVETENAERTNRRATIRRITELVSSTGN